MTKQVNNTLSSPRATMSAQVILNDANKCISTERQDQYGSPEDSFQTIADYWNVYLGKRGVDYKISACDVAHLMGLLKVARMDGQKYHPDNYVDACGYFALGAQMRERAEKC